MPGESQPFESQPTESQPAESQPAVSTPLELASAVLIHGCNLEAYHWNRIVWGRSPDRLGRIPKGILLALSEDARLVLFGTGASQEDGLFESQVMARELWERLDQIVEFEAFRPWLEAEGEQAFVERLRTLLESIVVTDTVSQNTREEIENAARVCLARGIERLILVSSPTHIVRCLRDACAIFDDEEELAPLRRFMVAAASDTNYMGSTANDVAVFEPPHRLDRPYFNINEFLKRVSEITEGDHASFLKRFDRLLRDFDV